MTDGGSSTESADRTRRIYCANCLHCKLTVQDAPDGEGMVLRVRCAAGKWRKRVGDEKFYKYFTLMRRNVDECADYVSMGELHEYLSELKRSLPTKDEILYLE